MLIDPLNTKHIFKLISEKKTLKEVKKKLFAEILHKFLFVQIISIIILCACYIINLREVERLDVFYVFFTIYLFITFISAKLTVKTYFTLNKVIRFSFEYFDRSISEISNASDSCMAGYLIDYLCIETAIYDSQKIYTGQTTENYGQLRQKVLKKYTRSKSPKIPFNTKEYEIYMQLLRHILNSPNSRKTFSELYLQ